MPSLKVLLTATAALACMVVVSTQAAASTYYYTNWTADTHSTSTTAGSATGMITTPTGTISVTYSGNVASSTEVNNTGTNYFTGWAAVYQSAAVANMPTRTDIVTLDESYTATPDKVTFSTPITNPIVDIVSLGSPGALVDYNFNATPTIVSQGSAYWGGCSTCLSVSGNSLVGKEGSGVVEFMGTYSDLTWTTTGGEYWNGFDIGVAGIASSTPPTTTPEPASMLLLGLGLGLAVICRRSLLNS